MTFRILVVDDDFATRMLASAALTSDGFETIEAENGLEALARFDEEPPAAVLIDVNMPELDGYEVCRRIRARATHHDTPVMIMTASNDVEAVRLAFAAGATDFLTKPLDLPLLGHRVRFMLRASAVAAEALESARKIVGLAYYDRVTGLPNRQFVERHLASVAAGEPRTAIVIELGSHHLDRISSASRDELIRAAAQRVIETVRREGDSLELDQVPHAPEDHTATTTVARLSADELVVISRFVSPIGEARRLADALLVPFPIGARRLRLGIASSPETVAALGELVAAADYAVQRAEPVAPRNVVAFTEIVAEQRGRHHALAGELAHALTDPSHDGLSLRYALRMSPATGEVVGVRAQACWSAADDGPALFATVLAQDPVLSDRLAQWTIERAARDGANWLAAGAAFRIAIEIPLSMFGGPADATALAQSVTRLGYRPDLIELELRDVPRDHRELDRAAAITRELRAMGFGLALASLDGATTLAQVNQLALETVRIDRATLERHGTSLLAVVIPAARAIGLRIAASGIDAPAALTSLEPHVVDEISGALDGPPLSADAVLGFAAPAFDTVAPGVPAVAS